MLINPSICANNTGIIIHVRILQSNSYSYSNYDTTHATRNHTNNVNNTTHTT